MNDSQIAIEIAPSADKAKPPLARPLAIEENSVDTRPGAHGIHRNPAAAQSIGQYMHETFHAGLAAQRVQNRLRALLDGRSKTAVPVR